MVLAHNTQHNTQRNAQLRSGQIILDRYVLEERIGVGCTGEVWRGHHRWLDVPVAIKLHTAAHAALFATERALVRTVRHPNVVFLLDEGEHMGRPVVVMELVEGVSLAEMLARHGAPGWAMTGLIVAQLAAGVEAIHREGFVHGDLKPENIAIDHGERGALHATLLDMGAARPIPEAEADAPLLLGTPMFMAPEVLMGQATDVRAEVYALGLVWYAVLFGTSPASSARPSDVLRRVYEEIELPELDAWGEVVPAPLRALLRDMLAHDPAARPGCMCVVRKRLHESMQTTLAAQSHTRDLLHHVHTPAC